WAAPVPAAAANITTASSNARKPLRNLDAPLVSRSASSSAPCSAPPPSKTAAGALGAIIGRFCSKPPISSQYKIRPSITPCPSSASQPVEICLQACYYDDVYLCGF